MQRNSDISTQLAAATDLVPVVRPDINALASKADLVTQRMEASLLTLHRPGSPEGELLQRALAGESVKQAAERLGETRGLLVSGEVLANLEEYQRWHFLVAPKIVPEVPPAFSQVGNPGLDRHAGVYATPGSGRRAVALSTAQLRAVDDYRDRLNADLGRSAAALSDLEANAAPGNPEYEKAHQAALAQYNKLLAQVEPAPAVMGLAESRANVLARLHAISSDPELSSRISPDLVSHYKSVARGGGPLGAPVPGEEAFANRSDASLRADLRAHSLDPGANIGTNRDALAQELARREVAPGLGAGVPRPTSGGRFTGMERPQDLPLRHELVLQVALLAEPGPNAEHLVAEMKHPVNFPGLNAEALNAMHQARRDALDRHRANLAETITLPPAIGPTLAERSGGQIEAVDLSAPPFSGDGPAGYLPPEPPDGTDGPRGPGGPAGPDQEVRGFGPFDRFKPAVVSPETHSAQELLKQIQEAEKAANARIRQERIFTAISAGGALLTATVAIAAEVGAAPMNPHADPGKALGHAATALNTVGLGVGQHLRQKVHERTKADSDIRAAIETYTREQRSSAETWAEKMSNQMDHLDHLIPPPAELDRLEHSVAASLQQDPAFRTYYLEMRDHNAYDIHMAAANELVLSDNPELQQAGLQVAQSLRANGDLQGASWKSLQAHFAELNAQNNAKSISGPLVGTYESYLGEMEHQFHAAAIQARTMETLRTALDRERLGALLGDEARARALLGGAASTDPQESRSPAQMLLHALEEKHQIERSIQDAWRDFAARSPLHAERVIHGGMDPATLLAHLYGRRSIEDKSPDRVVAEGLRDYFQNESRHRVGQGNQAERSIQLGIPRGWGEHTLAGSMIGVSPSQNGGTQAMLLGFKADSNMLDQATMHLFAREGVGRLPAVDLAAQGIEGRDLAAFQEAPQAPPPHAQLVIEGDLVRQLPTEQLASRIAQDYNLAIRQAFVEQAERQLDADAMAYAGLRTSGHPYRLGDAVLNTTAVQANIADFKARNAEAYMVRAKTLAVREAIQTGGARAMAAQLKECQTMGGFSQVLEANRGHFNYPPQRATLDRDPRVALEGKSGERAGRDLQRVLNQADNAILALTNEFKQAREKKLSIAKDPSILYKMSPKVAQLAACLDTPFRQSASNQSFTGPSRKSYDAAASFLARHGYGSLERNAP